MIFSRNLCPEPAQRPKPLRHLSQSLSAKSTSPSYSSHLISCPWRVVNKNGLMTAKTFAAGVPWCGVASVINRSTCSPPCCPLEYAYSCMNDLAIKPPIECPIRRTGFSPNRLKRALPSSRPSSLIEKSLVATAQPVYSTRTQTSTV